MAPDELQEKGLAELRTMAKALGVKNVGKYRKNELIEMLSGKSETPAPKKRGRPTKAAAAQKPAAPAAQKAEPAEEKPAPEAAAKPAPKGKNDRQRKQPPEKAKAPAPEKPQEPAQEAPKAEGKEETGEKDHRRNERAQSNRYQKGVNRHYSSFTNGERRYTNQNGQEQRASRPATPANPPANGEEEPHQRYTSVVFRDGGETHTLALLNDSKYSYDCPGGELRLTLLRNVIFADHYSDRPAAEFNFTDEGVQRFEYGVTAAPGDADTGVLTRLAAQFNLRPLVIPESFHKGDLPQRQGFIDVDADNVLLTALKTCEDGSGDTVLRLYETAGQASEVTVTCAGVPAPLKAAFGKFEIKTFRFDGEKWRETDFIER